MSEKTSFEKLYELNVNDKTENKNGLTYLSWAWAWAEFKKAHPDATYEVKKFENGLPYAYDPNTGYMVYTTVTVDELTHEMWLPVMDSNNKAMKNVPYEAKTKYKTFTVQPATMFDINKAIMRCLTKNLAMFGLGLYIYAGEDLPDTGDDPETESPEGRSYRPPKKAQNNAQNEDPLIDAKQAEQIAGLANSKGISVDELCKRAHIKNLNEMRMSTWVSATRWLNGVTEGGAA
jgi:hypothetical protein